MTNDELKQKQALPLEAKIIMSERRIREWVDHFGLEKVFVSFSGGKDSTVLLHIARKLYPNMLALFVNTGLEFPEVVKFVKSIENVKILKPEKTFKRVLDEYGWCFPGKDVALAIEYARKGSNWALNCFNGVNSKGEPSFYKSTRYPRWKFLIDAPFKISSKCCSIMKERPLDKYATKTKSATFVATLAEESARRKNAYMQTGCNAFDSERPVSKPLSFWTEQDILRYLKEFKIPYTSVYGDIVETEKGLQTTGQARTGCIFCPIGCHLDQADKFKKLAETHPKLYDYVINKLELGKFLDFLGIDYSPHIYIWSTDKPKKNKETADNGHSNDNT
jgi:3'-phosphoadenosine 5'-phosphosulfate sulfotransferase (PAPS reductase)/FAD synthetase